MIVQESLILGLAGGIVGIGIGMASLLRFVSGVYGAITPVYTPQLFVQAILVALLAGVAGGLYPAWRATRMRLVEALRYE